MKIPWSKIGQIASAIYRVFLKGKTVKVPGVGSVTLPSQGHAPAGSIGSAGSASPRCQEMAWSSRGCGSPFQAVTRKKLRRTVACG